MYIKRVFEVYLFLLLMQIPIIGGFFAGEERGTYVYAAIDLVVFLYFLVVFCTCRKSNNIGYNNFILFVLLFLSYALMSSIWSVSINILYGVQLILRDILRVLTILMAIKLLGRENTRHSVLGVLHWVVLAYALLAVTTMQFSYDYQGGAGRLMYPGYKDANGIAHDLGLMLVLSVWAWKTVTPNNKHYNWGLRILILLVLLGLVFSKTKTIALLSSILWGYYLYNAGYKSKATGLGIVAVFAIIFLLIKHDYLLQYFNEVQGGGAIATLSGRTEIWEVAKNSFTSAYVIFGAGINSFYNYSSLVLPNAPGQIHNDILQIVFSYGVVGAALYVLSAISFIRRRLNVVSGDAGLVVAIFLYYLIAGTTEGNLVSSVAPVWAIVVIYFMVRTVRQR